MRAAVFALFFCSSFVAALELQLETLVVTASRYAKPLTDEAHGERADYSSFTGDKHISGERRSLCLGLSVEWWQCEPIDGRRYRE